MRGVAEARAAISVVNALPLGIGAAVGIAWPARAIVRTGSVRGDGLSVRPRRARTALVSSAAATAWGRYGRGRPAGLDVTVRSTIPVSRGLKSSSAVGSAVVLAAARACGREPSAPEIGRLCAEVGRAVGVSATGAFDDALAGLVPYGVVTDNRRDVTIGRLRFEPDLGVALWIPGARHPPAPRLRQRFRRDARLARTAVDEALAGHWPAAMAANSTLVERAMGLHYARLHATAHREGAVASGVTGLGPTFAAVAPIGRLARILRAFPRAGRRRAVRLGPCLPPGSGDR